MICFEIMHNVVSALPCLHSFCAACASDWSKTTSSCAKCRTTIRSFRKNRDLAGVIDHHMTAFIADDHQNDAELTATIRASAMNVGAAAYQRQQEAIIARADSRPGLGAISCPTLVLCGRQDVLTPVAVHEEMASAIPDAKLVIVENSGHLAPLEQPEAVTAVLRYWLQG